MTDSLAAFDASAEARFASAYRARSSGWRTQPVPEHQVPNGLRAVRTPHVQVGLRQGGHQASVLVPARLPDRQLEPGPLECGHVRRFVAGVGHGQVHVDDGLGREARNARRSDVLQREHAISEGEPDPLGQHLELLRPRRVGIDHRVGRGSGRPFTHSTSASGSPSSCRVISSIVAITGIV